MSSRFEPDEADTDRRRSQLVDPEPYDASEQQFSASLEGSFTYPGFVLKQECAISQGQSPRGVDPSETSAERPADTPESSNPKSDMIERTDFEVTAADTLEKSAGPFQPDLPGQEEPSSWRDEVAARLSNYRARRRPRGPRYPSMRLKFGPTDPPAVSLARRQSVALESPIWEDSGGPAAPIAYAAPALTPAEPSAKIIEFPRPSAISQTWYDELAEPVLDRPRILEAPELVPAPPALGGILLETAAERTDERRPGFEVPLQPASMTRRVLAITTDAVLVFLAFAAFGYIFLKVTPTVPIFTQAAGISVVLLGLFWSGYQYLLLVYTGSTPGLKLAKLELSRFDGAAVPRNIRRWRVLVSVLSGVSVGLGYAWCFLDEDQLCWHDRITRTYMAPKKSRSI
jgi:RDD family protein